MLKSLRIHPEDDIYLLEDIENVFRIKITDEEAQSVLTVGQLFDVIASRFKGFENVKCDTTIVFNKLRRVISTQNTQNEIRPDTLMSEIVGPAPKDYFSNLSDKTDLEFDVLNYTKTGYIGIILIFMTFLSVITFALMKAQLFIYLATFITFIFGIICLRMDKMKLTNNIITIRDLCEFSAQRNFGKLMKLGARPTKQKLWDAYLEILIENSDKSNSNSIDRDTLLL